MRTIERRVLACLVACLAASHARGADQTWHAPLARANWQAQKSWLGNPADDGAHAVSRRGEATVFRVADAGRGMKWVWNLAAPISLKGRPFVSMRYRARRVAPRLDYSVCVLGPATGGGPGYQAVVSPVEIVADGRWHVLSVDAGLVAKKFPTITALALQVQADGPDATLEVQGLSFGPVRQLARLADAVPWQRGAGAGGFRCIPLGPAAKADSATWRKALHLADWFAAREITTAGIPFVLPTAEPSLAATDLAGQGELRIPVDPPSAASEVYLVLLAHLTGQDEPAYGGGPFRAIRDVDRFRLRLEYTTGTPDECLPMQVGSGRFAIAPGPRALVAAADPARKLRALVLVDRCKQAAFALAGVTLRTDPKPRHPESREQSRPLHHAPDPSPPHKGDLAIGWHTLRIAGGRRLFGGTYETKSHGLSLALQIDTANAPTLEKLTETDRKWKLLADPSALLELRVDGQVVPSDKWRQISFKQVPFTDLGMDAPQQTDVYTYTTPEGVAVSVQLGFLSPFGSLLVNLKEIRNTGSRPRRVSLIGPKIGPYALSKRPEDSWYLVPKRGAAFGNRPCSYAQRYCGLFPVQFVDTFSPSDRRGLCLWTTDRDLIRKRYVLRKADGRFTMGVEYPERTLAPGESFAGAATFVKLTDGHWRRGMDMYGAWLAARKSQLPQSHRVPKPWFREVFNFRQRFLWWLDPLGDAKTRAVDLLPALAEGRREFGGIDYLHVFDWGNVPGVGRVYGRVGDYSPFDHMKGGREGFRKAIQAVQKQGTPVGLYIEGYLLQENSKLGKAHGKAWQLVGPDGKGKYWPSSSEMMTCAGAGAWRDVQSKTYHQKVKELGVDGMYIDQFGFANAHKDCYSKDHGHPVPSYCVRTEHETTKQIRRAVDAAKKNVAIYTEETPVDVTIPYQDGSFTYAMNSAQRTRTRVPLNLTRFVFPKFKTIEILFCDKPTGSWATGVKWVFFNGEAIWLEGPASWFAPHTRAAIRKCHAILRKHRDAFTSSRPVPLVPTQTGGVYANAFPADDGSKTVYTFYNARHRTVRGPVLRLPAAGLLYGLWPGKSYYDEWHGRAITPRKVGDDHVIDLEIGPMDVGCVVVMSGMRPSPAATKPAKPAAVRRR